MSSDDSDDDIWDYKSLKRIRKASGSSSSSQISRKSRSQLSQKSKTFKQKLGKRKASGKRSKVATSPNIKFSDNNKKLSQARHSQRSHSGKLPHGFDDGDDTDVIVDNNFTLSAQPLRSFSFQKPKLIPSNRPSPSISPCNSESSDLPEISLTVDQPLHVAAKNSKAVTRSPSAHFLQSKSKNTSVHKSRIKQSTQYSSPATVTTPLKTVTNGNCPNCQMPFSSPALTGNPSDHVYECMDKPFTAEEECPHGLDCKSVIASHYKKFTHLLLASARAGAVSTTPSIIPSPPSDILTPILLDEQTTDPASDQRSLNRRHASRLSKPSRELQFNTEKPPMHFGGRKRTRSVFENCSDDLIDVWAMPLDFADLSTEDGLNSEEQYDKNVEEKDFGSDEDIFAYPDEGTNKVSQVEKPDENSNDSSLLSQSLLIDVERTPTLGIATEDSVAKMTDTDLGRIPLVDGVQADALEMESGDSLCATQNAASLNLKARDQQTTCNQTCTKCGCNRSKTIQENVNLCAHQCSQIQINIQLKPCQSACANEDSDQMQTSSSALHVQTENIVEEDDFVSVSEHCEKCLDKSDGSYKGDDHGRKFIEQAFEDEDWPEEEVLLASLADAVSGTQAVATRRQDNFQINSMQMNILDQNVSPSPSGTNDIITKQSKTNDLAISVRRPNLSRPTYRGIVKLEQSVSQPEVEAKQSQKSGITELPNSQMSNLGKFFAPITQTLTQTKAFTQTSLGSFFGWKSSDKTSQATMVVKTEKGAKSQNTSGNSTESDSFGWSGSSRTSSSHNLRTSSKYQNAAGSSSDTGTDSKGTYSRSKRQCPFYKKMPGTPFTVDAFRYGNISDCKAYFLSHFHYDHYGGLTRHFKSPVYCSKVTGNLVKARLKVAAKYIHPLPLNMPCQVEGIEVTLLEANHCPGAVLFLFKLSDGRTYLHTGDFRADPSMEDYPELRSCHIHQLYLDTTYCDPAYNFPTQNEVVNYASDVAVTAVQTNPKTLIVCGTYTIGKEKVFMGIAEALNCMVGVASDKKNILECLEDHRINAKITLNLQLSRLHVVTMATISHQKLKDYLKKYSGSYDSILAFKPTGWTQNGRVSSNLSDIKPSKNGVSTIYGIPYSEHSSFNELRRFVRFTRPDKILATVNNDNPKSRNAMNAFFQSWLSQSSCPSSPSAQPSPRQKSKRKRGISSSQSSKVTQWMK